MITHLAISGGASSGIHFVGSLKYLEETKLINNIQCILGTSVGSIIAVLLSYSSVEYIIQNIIYLQGDLNINEVDLNLFICKYGLLSKQKTIKSIENILLKSFEKNPTMNDLFEYSKKEVIITSYNLNKEKIEYFSYKTHPNMYVVDAIALSINIPFVFEKEIFQDNIYIDAGLINNLSWEYFSNIPKDNKFGIYLCLVDKSTLSTTDINLFDYLLQILKTVFKYSGSLYEKTLDLQNENIFLLKDELVLNNTLLKEKIELPPDDKINSMIQYGYNEMQLYLKKKI